MKEELASRRLRMQQELRDAEIDLAAIAPTANMRYLLGFAPLADERLCLLLATRDEMRLVVPALNAPQVEAHTGLTAMRWTDTEGVAWALERALRELGIRDGAVLLADDTMRADHLIMLQEVVRPGRSLPAAEIMGRLREVKSDAELAALQRAAEQADRALLAGVRACRPGASEREVADTISAFFTADGAQQVDFVIVASGPNSAYPHHEVSDRQMQPGDVVILDIGATLDGYHSDITRVVSLREPSDEVRRVYETVLEANRRGRAAAVAGATAGAVDAAARGAIEDAGYGQYFVHRTGHGLGTEVHERPYIVGTSKTVLRPGMVFSVEPGVYLTNNFGIRIEDIVSVRESGESLCLTGADHGLFVV